MEIFLRAKHWQLFIFTFGIPLVLQIFLMANIFSSLLHNPTHNPMVVFSYFKIIPVILIFSMGTLFGWFWAVATGLQKMIPAGVTMKISLFKVFFFMPLIYILLIVIGAMFLMNLNLGDIKDPTVFLLVFAIIFPLHFFSMFCIFYCLYFVAKTIKLVELQRDVIFSDYMGEFFLTWFFVIGVWIIQPRINKMVAERDDELSGAAGL